MAQAPPILIYTPGGGVSSPIGSNPPVYSQAGTTALIEDQDYIDVVFGSIQTDDEWVLVDCIVVNDTDVDPLNIWPGIITERTEEGFRVYLNGLPDSGNYYLHWSVSGINIEPSLASTYFLTGPATGAPGEAVTFTVSLPPSTYVGASVTVTLAEGGLEIGVFSPTEVTLTTDSPSKTFTFTPAVYGDTTITVNNDRGLTDPDDLAFTVVADTYTLSGPSAGYISVASSNFAVELPVGGVVAGTVTVTPDDGSDGVFTPTTVELTTASPFGTFTYTPASIGDKTISVTNDDDLTDPVDVIYAVSAPFSPLDITGCKLWLKADDGILGGDGTTISSWTDHSGNSYNFGVSTAFPIYKDSIVNGKPVVRFNGTTQYLKNSTSPIIPSGVTAYTLLVVVSAASVSAGTHNIGAFGGTSAGLLLRRDVAVLNDYQWNGATFANVSEVGGISAGVFNYITLDWDGANIHMWRNGVSKGTAASSGWGSGVGTAHSLGYDWSASGGAGGNFWDGDIAEVIVYNTALSGTDRGNVEAYLASKYGL